MGFQPFSTNYDLKALCVLFIIVYILQCRGYFNYNGEIYITLLYFTFTFWNEVDINDIYE